MSTLARPETPASGRAPASPPRSGATVTRRVLGSEHFVLALVLVYFAVLVPFVPRLASPANLENLLSNVWPLLAVAVGQTIVLIVAGIDLSQTAIMGMVSVTGAMLVSQRLDPLLFAKTPMWGVLIDARGGPLGHGGAALTLALVAMLLVGTIIGLLNGLAVAWLRIPAFMATLVSMMFFGALALWLTASENVSNLPDAFVALGTGGVGPLSWALLIAGSLAVLAHLLLTRTVLGRWLHATGASGRVALVSGVPTRAITLFAYASSGFCAALAAVLYTARLEAGRPTLGQNLLLDIIGAAVIGGTSLFGGKGKVLWTLYGVLFFALMSNTLNLLDLSFFTVNIVKGAVILLAALLDVVRTRILK